MKLRPLFHAVENERAIQYNIVQIGHESLEPIGLSMPFQIQCECGITHLGEEYGGVLKNPTAVIAIAVHHEDESFWWVL